MNGSLQYSALTRLLTLNNQVHDLQNLMLTETVPAAPVDLEFFDGGVSLCGIADLQDEIDRIGRASLATCWLGNSDAEDEEHEL